LTFWRFSTIFWVGYVTQQPKGDSMIQIEPSGFMLAGPKGSIPLRDDDEITLKLAMLFEGQCEGLGPSKAAEKFGMT
jgi:hypothetical protein